jgi:hypothetical protein
MQWQWSIPSIVQCNVLKEKHFCDILLHIKPASKHCNDVILSDAKNLAFSCCYEILHGACHELNYETLRFTQGDKAKGSG